MKKFKIYPYSKKFPKAFEKEKNKICKVIKINDIHHIGSTSVPGLGGKGMIDIMIGIENWKEIESITKKLRDIGFKHRHPKKRGRIFMGKYIGPSLENVHIHILIKRSREYKNLLAFRDYLRKNKKEIKIFFKLKLKWLKETKGDRKKYFKIKEGYVKEILSRIK